MYHLIQSNEAETFDGVSEFAIGNPSKTCSLHNSLILSVSHPLLEKSKNGPFEGWVRLEDVSCETFQRFAEWLYTLNYSTIPPSKKLHRVIAEGLCREHVEPMKIAILTTYIEPAPELDFVYPEVNSPFDTEVAIPVEEEPVQSEIVVPVKEEPVGAEFQPHDEATLPEVESDLFEPPPPVYLNTREKKLLKKLRLRSTITERLEAPFDNIPSEAFPVVDGSQEAVDVSEGSPEAVRIGRFSMIPAEHPDQGPEYSYLDSFLIHAQVYVFAEQYSIVELTPLAASKLGGALSSFKHYHRRAGDVVGVAEFVYRNTSRTYLGEFDQLRKVVADNIASSFEDLIKTAVFMGLWRQGGDFVEDVGDRIGQKLFNLKLRELL